MSEYLFTARTPGGSEINSKIDAASAAAAREQLQSQGLSNIVIHTDDFAARMYGENLVSHTVELDPAALIKAQKQGGIAGLILGLLKGSALFLVPLLAWNAYSLYSGDLGVSDWLGFFATVFVLLVFVWFAIPGILFESLLLAQLQARWEDALRFVALLRRFKQGAAIAPSMLDYHQAKCLIGIGRTDEALALFGQHRSDGSMPEMLWLSLQASLLDEAKRRGEAGELMLQLTEMMPDSAQVWLDLALNQALYGEIDTAKEALNEAEQRELSPLMAGVIPFVYGEIALREGRHGEAANLFAQSLLELSPFLSQTALRAMFIGIEARYAVALAYCGKLDTARQAWAIAEPVLAAHGEQKYIDDWAAAVAHHTTPPPL